MADGSACSSEDALLAFLEYLVDPVLPTKRKTLSESVQQTIGKQVHDVVLLYNYYQRKQNRLIHHLDYVEFCKLAGILRPNLMAHMSYIQSSAGNVMVDIENQTSFVERKIMDACCISMSLDVTKDTPLTNGWPISKVAVFLVDSRKEHCFLQFSTVTKGVWSMIENDVAISSNGSDTVVEQQHQGKRKRILFEPATSVVEIGFRKTAFSAVESASGIGQDHVRIIESYETYCLQRKKNAVRFYIMQCIEPSKDGAIKIPIASVMESLQGPLIQECLGSWSTTRAVDYFHVMPYSKILSDWLERGNPSNGLQDHNSRLAVHSNGTQTVGVAASTGTAKENLAERNYADVSSVVVGRHQVLDLDDSAATICKSKQSNYRDVDKVQIGSLEKVINFTVSTGKKTGDCTKEVADHGGEIVGKSKSPYHYTVSGGDNTQNGDHVCDTHLPSFQEGIKLQKSIASKEKALCGTAVSVLFSKMTKLAHQQRNIEDEMAQYKRNIQMILDGGEDYLALMLDAVIEGANDSCQWRYIQETSSLRNPGHHYVGCKGLSKVVTNVQEHCQELDYICCKNKWFPPSYGVYPIDNGFKAYLRVKGTDLDKSSEGEIRGSPGEARDSAAEVMLGELQQGHLKSCD